MNLHFFFVLPLLFQNSAAFLEESKQNNVTILKIVGNPVLNAMALNGSPGRMCRLGFPLLLTPRCVCGEKVGQPSALKEEELMGPEEHPCPERPCAPHTHRRGGERTRVCGPRALAGRPSGLTASTVWTASARHGGDYPGFLGVHGVVRNNIVGCVGIAVEVFSFRPSGQNAFPLMRKKVFPVFQLARCLPVEVTADAAPPCLCRRRRLCQAVRLSGGEKAFQLLRCPLEGPRGQPPRRGQRCSWLSSGFPLSGGDSHVLQTPLGDMALLS